MYEAFDEFLATDWWLQGNYRDDERFMKCLVKVVLNRDFSPEKMGDYFRSKRNTNRSEELDQCVGDFVSKASTVLDYLRARGEL